VANLRDRLKRIQEIKKIDVKTDSQAAAAVGYTGESNEAFFPGWKLCAGSLDEKNGCKVLKREVTVRSPFNFNKKIPPALKVLVSDLAGGDIPGYNDFLFFDLETTGLSGGAGTVAFLAAFGRTEKNSLRITQYLLLDYSGENDFLENALLEFNNEKKIIVTYNGKSFDSQILKTRCLMNRFKPPVYRHVDLLHPCRRLWKNIIHDCGQASIETKIIGIDRSDDIPGSLAPDIWFEFLKTGNTERLSGICDHNIRDISGLASILASVISIAENPFTDKYSFDIERIALFWRAFLRREKDNPVYRDLQVTGNNLLCYAAKKNHPRAVYVYAYDQMKSKNYFESLKFVRKGLELFDEESIWRRKLIRRKEYLEKKINKG